MTDMDVEKAVRAFLLGGGEVREIPRGQCGDVVYKPLIERARTKSLARKAHYFHMASSEVDVERELGNYGPQSNLRHV